MNNENKLKNINAEIKDILKNFPPQKMWKDGNLVLELKAALSSKSEHVKKSIINKYHIWKNK